MSENQQQAQESQASTESRETASSARSSANSDNQQSTQRDSEIKIPKHRLDEESRKRKEAEQKLQQYEQEREQAEQQQAEQQGQYQKLAEQRAKKLESVQKELEQLRASWTEERRRNTWNQAAQGIINPSAIADAYVFLDESDLSAVEESDMEGYKKLAQNLAEVKPHFAVEGVRGAGSGGSDRPVLGLASNNKNGTQTQNRQAIFHNPAKKRRPWK